MGFHYPELLTRMLTEYASCARNEILTLRTKKARPLAWRRSCMIIPSNCTRIWSWCVPSTIARLLFSSWMCLVAAINRSCSKLSCITLGIAVKLPQLVLGPAWSPHCFQAAVRITHVAWTISKRPVIVCRIGRPGRHRVSRERCVYESAALGAIRYTYYILYGY